MIGTKALRHEYAEARRYIQKQNRRLESAGLPTLPVKKIAEMSSESELRRELRKIEKFRGEGRATIRGSRAYEEQKRIERERRAEERRAKRREYERRRRQEYRDFYKSLDGRDRQMVDYLKRQYNWTIRSRDELEKWFEYLNKRNAMAGKKAKYKFDKFVDEFLELKKQGYTKEPAFSDLMNDFNMFLTDASKIEENMKNMKLSYNTGFIDQLYSEYIDKIMNESIDRDAEQSRRERRKERRK